MTEELEDILFILKERQKRNNPKFYAPLDVRSRRIARDYYRSQLALPEEGNPLLVLRNKQGTLISRGYTRVVVGDYGAYVEMAPERVAVDNLRPRWSSQSNRAMKYLWLVTKDEAETKVYQQTGTVRYADYLIGMYYIDPIDLDTQPSHR